MAVLAAIVGVFASYSPSFAKPAAWARARSTSATASLTGSHAPEAEAHAAPVNWQPSGSNPRWDGALATPTKPEPRTHAAAKRAPTAAAARAPSTPRAAKPQSTQPTSNEDAIQLLKKELAQSM